MPVFASFMTWVPANIILDTMNNRNLSFGILQTVFRGNLPGREIQSCPGVQNKVGGLGCPGHIAWQIRPQNEQRTEFFHPQP